MDVEILKSAIWISQWPRRIDGWAGYNYLLFINSPDVFAKHVSLVEFVKVLRINAFYRMPLVDP